MTRTEAQVRSDIGREREELAGAVEHLRGSLGDATDLAGKLHSKLPVVAAGAAAAGGGLAGGRGAPRRDCARRGRDRG